MGGRVWRNEGEGAAAAGLTPTAMSSAVDCVVVRFWLGPNFSERRCARVVPLTSSPTTLASAYTRVYGPDSAPL